MSCTEWVVETSEMGGTSILKVSETVITDSEKAESCKESDCAPMVRSDNVEY